MPSLSKSPKRRFSVFVFTVVLSTLAANELTLPVAGINVGTNDVADEPCDSAVVTEIGE